MTDSLKVQGIEIAQIVAIKRCHSNKKKKKLQKNEDNGKVSSDIARRQTLSDKDDGSVVINSASSEKLGSSTSTSSSSSSSVGRAAASTVDISILPGPTEGKKCDILPTKQQINLEKQQSKRLKRLKIYYAKRNEGQNKKRKVIKLKKLTLEADKLHGSGTLASEDSFSTLDWNSLEGSSGAESLARLSLEDYAQLIERQLAQQKRPRRLLVFVNPFGGKGRALHLFKSKVRRLFELAQIDYTLIVTKYANHARETVEDPQFDLSKFDGLICIGGDGMFAELMNGLLFRSNRHLLQQANNRAIERGKRNSAELLGGFGRRFEWPQLPLGVIGAGSTDANLFGFSGTNDVTTATLNIILGQQIQVDVCSIHELESDRLLRFASTFVAYGYFGDVLRESEKLRWLGPRRYDLTAVNRLLKSCSYQGLVRIWRSLDDGRPQDSQLCDANCSTCLPAGGEKLERQHPIEGGGMEDDSFELIEKQGPFVGVNAAVTACRCPQTKKGFSPGNHLANGCADLILVRPCSRIQYVNYLLRTGYSKKSAFDLKYVDAYRCRQFELIVGGEQQRKDDSGQNGDQQDQQQQQHLSSWNADGEILHEQSIRVKVNKRLLRVFGTGSLSRCR